MTTTITSTEHNYNSFGLKFWLGKVDSRPLSVLRILYAGILLKIALYHIPITNLFYSDNGVYPRWAMLAYERLERFSLMDALSQDWMVYLFWGLWIVVLILLLVGYRTRPISIISFILLVSVQERNTYLISGSDIVLRVMSFWMMFVPLAQYYSVDAVLRRWRRYRQTRKIEALRVETEPRTTFAFPFRALQIQFALIYLFTAGTKWTGTLWWSGDALFYALSLKTMVLPTGEWFVNVIPYTLLQLMTYMTVIFESLFFFLVFSPVFQPYATVVGLFYVGIMHVGIGLLMSIPDFSLVMLASFPLFFKAAWIERIDYALRAKRQKLIVPPPQDPADPLWLVLALTSPNEISLATAETITTITAITTEQGERLQGREALKAVAAHFPFSRFWLWTLNIPPVYGAITGTARWWMCRKPLLPEYTLPEYTVRPPAVRSKANRRLGYLGKLTIVLTEIILLFFVFWYNGRSIEYDDNYLVKSLLPRPAITVLNYTGLYQGWYMFSPNPVRWDGFIILKGTFQNGPILDVRTLQDPVTETEIPHYSFGTDINWRKWEENVESEQDNSIMSAWSQYYCRQYNEIAPISAGNLLRIEIVWRRHGNKPKGVPEEPLSDEHLYWYNCN